MEKSALQKAQAKMKMKKKDKRGAMMCLKRKKMYETELNKLSTVYNLEQQIWRSRTRLSTSISLGL